jgi:formylglycine-generating enzyme required for sulfatase activity
MGGADGGTAGADGGADGGTGGADAGTDGADGGMDACGFVGPSCAGGLMCRGESCCTSLLVTGGTFNRSNNASYPATLGAFCLDKYEVTVGRFRKFHADYDRWISAAGGSHPTAGEGAHDSPVITGSGWDAGWKSSLPASAAVLTDGNHLKCSAPTQTWRDLPGSGTPDPENYPINCLSWFEAFAFCTWDGGFLPTEAQWEYAAAGGSEERIYPWGNVATEPLPANYANKHAASVVEVGSEPSGNGRWGQGDLAGSMFEWNLDYYGAFPVPCNDCFNRNVAASRVLRGGAWSNTADILPAAYRVAYTPSGVTEELGARCARTAR